MREGKIELRIARIPGVRSKVAVSNASDERGASSPIGICVGERGSRIRLMRDMLGEEIDLLAYEPDPITFVHAALHPAKVRRVEQADGGFVAVVSEEEQANVAGADGQGLKLASMLVGAPITLRVEDASTSAEQATELVAGDLPVHPPERPPVRQRGRARLAFLQPARPPGLTRRRAVRPSRPRARAFRRADRPGTARP